MAAPRILVVVLLVAAHTSCARRAPEPTMSAADLQACIQACGDDQLENPEESPYDCRAVCEGGEMGSVSPNHPDPETTEH